MSSNDNAMGLFMFYRSEDDTQSIRVFVEDETVWVTQQSMSDIFDIDVSGITKHLKNIFDSGELIEISNVQKLHIANSDKPVKFYNLNVIISVGYRVNSYKATKFRIWATNILHEYLIKGFVMDDERLKNGKKLFNKDYFEELLARIAEIRASEARFYEKIRDLFAISYDYDSDDKNTYKFFANAQNKLEYAITGKTAAELIQSRANADLPYMGLTTWKGKKKGQKIISTDITVAKNYLLEEEIKDLNRLVSMFLDYSENYVRQKKKKEEPILMNDWQTNIDRFLEFNNYSVLDGFGSRTKKIADNIAKNEFIKFRKHQDQQFNATERALENIQIERQLPNTEKNIKTHNPLSETIWRISLVIMYKNQHEFITTKQLQKEIPSKIEIPINAKQKLKNRNDSKLNQYIRNLASHRKNNFVAKGYATYSKDGFKITQKGIDFVEQELIKEDTNNDNLTNFDKSIKKTLEPFKE